MHHLKVYITLVTLAYWACFAVPSLASPDHKALGSAQKDRDLIDHVHTQATPALPIALWKRAPMDSLHHNARRNAERRRLAAQRLREEQVVVPSEPLTDREVMDRIDSKISTHLKNISNSKLPESRQVQRNKTEKWQGRKWAIENKHQTTLRGIWDHYHKKENNGLLPARTRASAARHKAYYATKLTTVPHGGQSSSAIPAEEPDTLTGQYDIPSTPFDNSWNQPAGNWNDFDPED